MAANLAGTLPGSADGEDKVLQGLYSDDLNNQDLSQEKDNPEHLDDPEERLRRDEEITQLARRATAGERSVLSIVEGDPFARGGDELDPASPNFSPRAWTKAVIRAWHPSFLQYTDTCRCLISLVPPWLILLLPSAAPSAFV